MRGGGDWLGGRERESLVVVVSSVELPASILRL